MIHSAAVTQPANIASFLPLIASERPQAVAIACPAGRDSAGRTAYLRLSYRELDKRSARIARGLESYGIGRGVRTVLMVRPGIDLFCLVFGMFRAGAVPVLVDPGIGRRHLKRCIANAEPAAFIGVPVAQLAAVALGWGRRTIRRRVTVGGRLPGFGASLAEIERLGGRGGPDGAVAPATDDTAAIEQYCRANAIEFAWQPDGELRTRQRRSAVVRHPVTGQRCWFNQIAFLNEWTLAPEVREFLVDVYGAEGLPFNTCFGNGDPIGADIVELLNSTYEAHTDREPWQAGDLLLVDNIRTAHSRDPYSGPREVLAAMADPVRLSDCSPTFEETSA